ncbi:MAG: uroporphyrinogen-III C-methyltransferase [Microthrixaceae bacterium]|nr:uroporphyrinogen-III C-methyltransferase [Microthrixaceae bacterium]
MSVHLVGAGPGDPGLLTLRAAELLRRCDVVVHDRLCGSEILDMIPPWAERVDVGKTPGAPSISQHEINEILVDRGSRFDCVVRLKGGDPFVFGRGAEEIEALAAAGIETDVVPGITSAIAGAAAAGIAITTRGLASGFTVVTARQEPGAEDTLDWSALAKLGTTLVVLMGARLARRVAERLLDGGMAPDTPVAIVTEATLPTQTETRTTLDQLGLEPVPNPSVLVIGAVAAVDLRRVPQLNGDIRL